MDTINEALKCSKCKHVLSEPVALPCGELICDKHVNKKITHFYCLECDLDHPFLYPGGFFRVKALEKILSTKIDKCDFSGEYSRAYKSCKNLEQALFEFDKFRSDPYNHIYEAIIEIRNEVELKRETIKLETTTATASADGEVDEKAEALINEINEFESECKANLESNEFKEKKTKLDQVINVMKQDLSQWLNELNSVEEDKPKWNMMFDRSQKAIKLLALKELAYKQDLLLNRKLELNLAKPNELTNICKLSLNR